MRKFFLITLLLVITVGYAENSAWINSTIVDIQKDSNSQVLEVGKGFFCDSDFTNTDFEWIIFEWIIYKNGDGFLRLRMTQIPDESELRMMEFFVPIISFNNYLQFSFDDWNWETENDCNKLKKIKLFLKFHGFILLN